ncbi:MAG: hypothetical protein LBJ31_10005 [Treponema sp.]|jgi:hypothetical protein|nr:hypothetical protein [Treponema sp.]
MNTKKEAAGAKPARLKDLFSDRFLDTWKLLSETTQFLSRTRVFHQYEEELRRWRHELQSAGKNTSAEKQVRGEITEVRKSLRQMGYDLALARQQLVIDGFRNDASQKEGFRRVVLFFADDNIYWLAGDDNHVTLSEMLERELESLRTRNLQIRSKHYLWYKRRGNDLVLSGSDTETKEDFERLKAMGDANSLVILSKLKGLKG